MRRCLILRTSGSEFRGGLTPRVFSAVILRSDSPELNLQGFAVRWCPDPVLGQGAIDAAVPQVCAAAVAQPRPHSLLPFPLQELSVNPAGLR
jgi:hypothetical protein